MRISTLIVSFCLFFAGGLLAGDKEDIVNQIIAENNYANISVKYFYQSQI